jgi:CBS domain-containing membrane protein
MQLSDLWQRLARAIGVGSSASLREMGIATLVALLAMLAVAAVSQHFIGIASLMLVASIGASTVLVLAVPHSPMAQPWAVVGGQFVSALVGVTCQRYLPNVVVAAAVAVAGAILAMHLLRCLHAPGGATTLTAVIGGAPIADLGYGFVLAPVGLNVLILMAAALLLNNLVPGRRYPLGLAPPATKAAEPIGWPLGKFGLVKGDLELALKDMNAVLDVTEEDLSRIYSKAMLHAYRRRMGEIHIADIMVKDVVTAEFGSELEEIWGLMRSRKVKGVPVIDRARHVIGIVTIIDFLKHTDARGPGNVFQRLARFIRRTPSVTADKAEVVGQIMTAAPITARADAHLVSLIPLFAQHQIHHVPVVDAQDKLVGMVTQSDLMAALYNYRVSLS